MTSAALLVTTLVTGCSTQTKHFWLNVFFEGVDKTNQVAAGTAALAPTSVAPQASRPAEPPLYIHPPFAEQKCSGCHESLYSQKMRPNLGEACLGCHKTLLVAGKVWHAPAASGDCVLCHEPHQSTRKFLLAQAPNALCSQCHEPAEIAKLPAHKGKAEVECTRCHDPHQSDNKFLLEPKGTKTGGDVVERSENPQALANVADTHTNPAQVAVVRTNASTTAGAVPTGK